MFQAYLVTCCASGKRYVGITSVSLRRRWIEHVSSARRRPQGGALYAAIRKYGPSSFTITSLASAKSWAELCDLERALIKKLDCIAPNGYNLTEGGDGRYGFKPSEESVERSAAKHRGRPCHPNTRAAAIATHKGKPKPIEQRMKISQSRLGFAQSEETKTKLSAYWAARRARGEFKTSKPYEHARESQR